MLAECFLKIKHSYMKDNMKQQEHHTEYTLKLTDEDWVNKKK